MLWGAPLLGWPSMMDQVTNCWLATHYWRVVLTLERNPDNQASREQVERGVRQLMEGPSTRSFHAFQSSGSCNSGPQSRH